MAGITDLLVIINATPCGNCWKKSAI